MRKRWLAILLLVEVLAIGITSGIVLAFNQAAREMEDEALQQRLGQLVKQGRLTPEEADDYGNWYQSRPDALSPALPFGGFGRGGFHRGPMWGGRGWGGIKGGWEAPSTPTPETSGLTPS